MSENVNEVVPFPLYHGTSSHFLSSFRAGATPAPWPHQYDALSLLRRTWTSIQSFGLKPEWYVEKVLNQTSEHTNWQHGELYVTPSKASAVRYAINGAENGGELLTFCREAIDILCSLDSSSADHLLSRNEHIARFLSTSGWPPILVKFDNLLVNQLTPENKSEDVVELLQRLEDENQIEIIGQQTNFRITHTAGVVSGIFEIGVTSEHNNAYSLREL